MWPVRGLMSLPTRSRQSLAALFRECLHLAYCVEKLLFVDFETLPWKYVSIKTITYIDLMHRI